MKLLFIQLLLLPSLLLASSVESLADISRALGAGDVAALDKFLDSEVELSVLGADDFFSKAEATAQLKSFFAKHAATKFTQIHTGTSPTTQAEYCIGNLEAGGKTFRVVIYLAQVNGALKIKKMSFDEE
ncbi:hypothetical protein CEQ90_12915 [Lewinellaceae bacterium SD302]|nr:hypothetical protein CEQ90_12915 [Lewinellaceae bacterium SD302]